MEVLREIEFDRATGKLSDADYGTLKSAYTARALAELRSPASLDTNARAGAGASGQGLRRVCAMCAATSPPDAIYCARCAHYLARACPACHGPVTLPAARYCSWCGGRLAAREENARQEKGDNPIPYCPCAVVARRVGATHASPLDVSPPVRSSH